MANRNNRSSRDDGRGSWSEHRADVRFYVRTDNDRNSAGHRNRHLARHDNSWVNADARNHAAGHCQPNSRNSNSDTRNRNSRDHESKYDYTGNHTDEPAPSNFARYDNPGNSTD
jgi:hypothetical protein